jgi:hypothetical protein
MDTLVEGSQQRAETPTPTTNLKYSPKKFGFSLSGSYSRIITKFSRTIVYDEILNVNSITKLPLSRFVPPSTLNSEGQNGHPDSIGSLGGVRQ